MARSPRQRQTTDPQVLARLPHQQAQTGTHIHPKQINQGRCKHWATRLADVLSILLLKCHTGSKSFFLFVFFCASLMAVSPLIIIFFN